ncbi:hypothetical protein INT48_000362 [Thamnidium elegans]|uniref:Uncharacterized protein n=1 Tax=Thamnidium elegans TaxID=101142 RepID=A0A8H7VVP5_9FUNG|nr:hypothetical protein INT48_000362 [Thamnidium elegans]
MVTVTVVVLKVKMQDAGVLAKGDDVVGVDNIHLPGDTDLRDGHGANDIDLVAGECSVDTNLLVQNAEIYGNMNPVILENKFLSPTEKMDDNTVSTVFHPFVVEEKECGGSDPSFFYFKNTKSQASAIRRSRLRVRRFIRSCPGAPRCTRVRPLRFFGSSSSRFSSSLVEYMEVDCFDELEKMEVETSSCEPMDIDSFEEMSVSDQELVVGNFGSFSFGYVPTLKEGSFEPVVTGAGSPVISMPLPPSCGVFLKEPVPSDVLPVATGKEFETSVSKERGRAPIATTKEENWKILLIRSL